MTDRVQTFRFPASVASYVEAQVRNLEVDVPHLPDFARDPMRQGEVIVMVMRHEPQSGNVAILRKHAEECAAMANAMERGVA